MSNKYAVIDDSLVVNVVTSTDDYAKTQGWIILSGDAGIGWSYVNQTFVPPVPPTPTPEEIQAQNKATASSLLQETDWTTIPDVADSEVSNPYLINAADFAAYRSQVRAIAVNPPTTPATFPTKPNEQWSS